VSHFSILRSQYVEIWLDRLELSHSTLLHDDLLNEIHDVLHGNILHLLVLLPFETESTHENVQ